MHPLLFAFLALGCFGCSSFHSILSAGARCPCPRLHAPVVVFFQAPFLGQMQSPSKEVCSLAREREKERERERGEKREEGRGRARSRVLTRVWTKKKQAAGSFFSLFPYRHICSGSIQKRLIHTDHLESYLVRFLLSKCATCRLLSRDLCKMLYKSSPPFFNFILFYDDTRCTRYQCTCLTHFSMVVQSTGCHSMTSLSFSLSLSLSLSLFYPSFLS